jgi:outer membrane protein TolC
MLQAAAADVGVATGQMLPALSLSASMGRGGLWLSALSKTGTLWGIGAAISQPLFHGGALHAQRRAALATYDAAAARYRETVIAAFQNVADSLSALVLGAQALAAAEQAASAAQQDFMRETEREQLGVLAPAAVRASQASWISAQLDEIRHKGARLSNTAALFVALGSPPEPNGNAAPAETLK